MSLDMTHDHRHSSSAGLRRAAAVVQVALVLILSGCSLARERAPEIEPWALDYDSPDPPAGAAPINAALKVERFGGLGPCGDTAMTLRPEPHRVDSLPYDRWLESPAAQIADLLERDLARAGVFAAVFGPVAGGHARWRLLGTVEECTLEASSNGWRARLAVRVSLIDNEDDQPSGALVLQRLFSRQEPAAGPTASEMAAALSTAMAGISTSIRDEIGAACRPGSSGGTPRQDPTTSADPRG